MTPHPLSTPSDASTTVARSPGRAHRGARDQGFTLVEVLVVVVIVSILAAVAVPAFTRQRDKAAAGATQANMRNLRTLLITAQETSQQRLSVITGSGCSSCSCRITASSPLPKVGDTNFTTTTCGQMWTTIVTRLANASGESVTSTQRLMTDGWGYPITIDENEAENPVTCGTAVDTVWSSGPNHQLTNAADGWRQPDDLVITVNASGYC